MSRADVALLSEEVVDLVLLNEAFLKQLSKGLLLNNVNLFAEGQQHFHNQSASSTQHQNLRILNLLEMRSEMVAKDSSDILVDVLLVIEFGRERV